MKKLVFLTALLVVAMAFVSGCSEQAPEETPTESLEQESVTVGEGVQEEIATEDEMAEEEIGLEETPQEGMNETETPQEGMNETETPQEGMNETETPQEGMNETEMNIVETAAAAGDFDTLVTAIQTAGLEETLSGDGPYTVFAPTDAAFGELPTVTLDDLLQDETALSNVLLYHVADGEIDVTAVEYVITLQGGELTVDPTSDPITIGDANIIGERIETSNGYIYPIDTVLLPPE